MQYRLSLRVVFLVALSGLLFSASNATAGAFYKPTPVESREAVYQCDKRLIGVDSLGEGLYLAGFKSQESKHAPPDLQFVMYNTNSAAVIGTFLLEVASSYSVERSVSGDLIVILYSIEGNTSTCIINEAAEILQNVSGVALVVAGIDLVGVRNYSPKQATRKLREGYLDYKPLPKPGPYADCEWACADSYFDVAYLSSERVLSLHRLEEEGRPTKQVILTAYDSSCGTIWECERTALAFQAHGRIADQLFGIITSYSGSELIDMKTGKTKLLASAGAFAPAFGDLGLFFHGKLNGANEYTINRLDAHNADPVAIAPYYSGLQPRAFTVENGFLYALGGPDGCHIQTGIFARDFKSAVILEGVWRIFGQEEHGFAVVGGDAYGGVLYRGIVNN